MVEGSKVAETRRRETEGKGGGGLSAWVIFGATPIWLALAASGGESLPRRELVRLLLAVLLPASGVLAFWRFPGQAGRLMAAGWLTRRLVASVPVGRAALSAQTQWGRWAAVVHGSLRWVAILLLLLLLFPAADGGASAN